MPAGPRPRRSAASGSFAHLFEPIKLEGDNSSSSSDEGNADTSRPASDKKKGKRKTLYIPEESSGSEFEVENAGGSGGGADEDDDDDTITTEADDDDNDLGSDGSDAGDTDVSGSVVSGSASPKVRGGKSGRKRNGNAPSTAAAGPSRARAHANVVITGAVESGARGGRTNVSDALPARVQVSRKHPPSGINNTYSFFGPLSSSLPTRTLAPPTEGGSHVYLSEGVARSANKGLSDKQVEELLEQWTGNPFGVEAASVRDVGWLPGRYDAAQGAEKARWGGWYPEVTVKDQDIVAVTNSALSDYLPLPSYPLRSQAIHSPSDGDGALADSTDAAEAELELPTPPPPFQTGRNGSNNAAAGPSWASRARTIEAVGGVKLKVGQINAQTQQRDEEEVELPRFSSVRLDAYISRKPGHLFNAGAAVRAVKWGPRADGPSEKEYLAVTTVSNPEAPLRHVAPSADGATSRPRSMLQLWSVPCSPARDELSYELSYELPEGEEAQASRGRMKLEVGFCIEGDVGEIAWCPRGGVAEGEVDAHPGAAEAAEPEAAKETEHTSPKKVGKTSKGKGKAKAKKQDQGRAVAREEGTDKMELDSDSIGSSSHASQLGILATVMADGGVGIFVIPHPRQVQSACGNEDTSTYFGECFSHSRAVEDRLADNTHNVPTVKLDPLLRLHLPNSTIFSVAWGGHEMIAVGCTDGTIAVWQVGNALRSGGREAIPRPTHVVRAHSGVIRSLLFVPTPQPSLVDRRKADLDKPPTGLVAVGYDGVATLCDLRAPDLAVTSLYQQRAPINHVAFCAVSGIVYTHDAEDRIKGVFLKPSSLGSEGRIGVHRGPVWSLAASPHHGLVASTSSDGTAMLSSGVRALRKRRVRGHFTQKLFRFDFSRETGELRMWDNLDVEHRQALDPSNITRTSKKGAAAAAADQDDTSTAAWALEQGVLCSDWHPSMDRCALLATGTGSGLGRIDWVEGTAQAVATKATTA
ncbi:hypothetical protein JCM10908_000361 [Rhodotorula pacifica]|uniref:uncharacterized protein n=1 Tax=Rhodotorula pacifica TaxID=1495444 RepID=UPI00316D657C